MRNLYLVHHGIEGQKWGIRRFQNEDGSVTPAGAKRYYVFGNMFNRKGHQNYSGNTTTSKNIKLTDKQKKALKIAGGVALAGLATYAAVKVGKYAAPAIKAASQRNRAYKVANAEVVKAIISDNNTGVGALKSSSDYKKIFDETFNLMDSADSKSLKAWKAYDKRLIKDFPIDKLDMGDFSKFIEATRK